VNHRAPLERAARVTLTASIAAVTFDLSTAQILFGLAALAWLYLIVTDERRQPLPAFAWPLLGYSLLTVASALLSSDRRASLIDCKQLVLFLMVPMVMRLLTGEWAMRALNVIIAVGAAAALLGVVEYSMLGFDNLGNRPPGSLDHYMTYSGVIMLVLSAALARLLFYPQQTVWPAVAIPALLVALGATQTRGVWIGAVVAVVGLLAAKRPKLLLGVPVLVVVAFLVTPAPIKSRAASILDWNDPSNRDRVQMAGMGVAMVRDHPWFGVGPEMVGRRYGDYLPPNPALNDDGSVRENVHLHNVPIQIAAERGLPALAMWLVFVGVAVSGLTAGIRRGAAPALSAAGFGAMLAMLSAGLFEYNFGDSEFLMLFLALIALPFAADHADVNTVRSRPPASS
jgi:O-antigen ligase